MWEVFFVAHLEQRNMGEHTKHAPQNFEDEKWTSRSLWWVALWRSRWQMLLRLYIVREMMVGTVGWKRCRQDWCGTSSGLSTFWSPRAGDEIHPSTKKKRPFRPTKTGDQKNNREQKGFDAKLSAKSKEVLDRTGRHYSNKCYCQLQELQGGGPPQLQIDSNGTCWGDFGGWMVGGFHCQCSGAWSHGNLPAGIGLGRCGATFRSSLESNTICFCCVFVPPVVCRMGRNLAMCLINWWLHSGRSVSNSTLQKKTTYDLWQLKRNHYKHWRPAIVWRLECWTSHRPINGLAVCCPRLMQAQGNTELPTDCRLGPVHFMLTHGFFATKWFQWHFIRNVLMLCWHRRFVLQPGTASFLHYLRWFDVHCRKLFRCIVGPPPDIDWNLPWHTPYFMHGATALINSWNTMEYHGSKIWSAKYLPESTWVLENCKLPCCSFFFSAPFWTAEASGSLTALQSSNYRMLVPLTDKILTSSYTKHWFQ